MMITYHEACQLILERARPLPGETVRVGEALGRIVYSDVTSPVALPPFDNSAMDGFAIACRGQPVAAGTEFIVGGLRAAGDVACEAGEGAWRIMTGAVVPGGLDTVVPVEQVSVLERDESGDPLRIRIEAEVRPTQNVRYAGQDVAAGAVTVAAGHRFDPMALKMLSATGVGEVQVRRRPRVAVLSTGRELIEGGGEAALASGQIFNSNGPYLEAALAGHGAEVVMRRTIADDPAAYIAAVREAQALGCDVILSTGAVSMGDFDFVPTALAELGATPVFHKVRMRPGKPLLFATLPESTLVFGLPGNPASAAVGLRFYVDVALRTMLGLAPEPPLRARLLAPVEKKAGLRFFLKALLTIDAEGQAGVRVLSGQESFRIAPLVAANVWAVLPEDVDTLRTGELVDVHPLMPHSLNVAPSPVRD